MVAQHVRRMISSLKTWAVRLKGWRGKRQRLWLRLLGYYIALGLVPVLLVDIFVLNTARNAIEEAVLDSRREMAHRTAAEIARVFSPVAADLQILAHTVGTEPQDVDALLKKDALESREVEGTLPSGRLKPNTGRERVDCTARFLRLGRDLGEDGRKQSIRHPDQRI